MPKSIRRSNIASDSFSDERSFGCPLRNSVDENIKNNIYDDDFGSENNLDTRFIYTEFGENEIWYRCRGCGSYAHKESNGVEVPDTYLSEYCECKQ